VHLPTGVVDPEITIADERFVQSRAIVDLDAVRKSKDRSILDPANLFLRGTVELRISGYVVASNGKGQFQLESATIVSLPVPKCVLQELIYYYTRTPDYPEGFNLDKPFELPASIREVTMTRGSATVVQ